MNVMEELTEVFHLVFDDDTIILTREMTADDLDAWDSMSHTTLLMAAEDHFEVEFEDWEVMNLPDVGALADLIEKKLAE
jgi:acyl carrier protein